MPSCGVRLSVCLSRLWIFFKTNNRVFKFFCHRRVAILFQTKHHGNILTETPLTEVLNAGGVGRNRDSEQYLAHRVL